MSGKRNDQAFRSRFEASFVGCCANAAPILAFGVFSDLLHAVRPLFVLKADL